MEITEDLSRLKESLAAAEAKAAMLDVLPTPVMQLDKDGAIVYLNPAGAAVLGLNRQHMVGMNCHNVLQTPQCRTGQCLCHQAINTDSLVTGETVVDPAGLNIPIRFTGTPIKDAAGNITGAVVSVVDIRQELDLLEEILHLKTGVVKGDLTARGDVEKFTGHAKQIVQGLNDALDAITEPLQVVAAYVERIAKGDIPEQITAEYQGDFDQIKHNLNQWIEVFNNVMTEVTDIAQAVAQGQLATRADLSKYQGAWVAMVKGVNAAVENLRAPLRDIGSVLVKMAAGDLKVRVTHEYQGEYHVLRVACNELGNHLLGVQDVLRDLKTAVGNGQLGARGNAHQFKGDLAAIVQGCNDVLDAVTGPLNVMADYVARLAQGSIPNKIIDEYKGDFNGIKHNLNSLIDTLQSLATAADAIANGDLSVQITGRSEDDVLLISFQHIVEISSQFVAEMHTLTEATITGRLDVRGNVGTLKGDFAKIVRKTNAMLDAVIGPLNIAAEYVDRLAGGNIPAKITDEYKGDFSEIKSSINHCIDAFNDLIAETASMAEAAARGDWNKRADLSKYEGGWAMIARGVNKTIENLIAPLRDIGSVLDRMASGNLKVRVTNDYKGDYNLLKGACNDLGEQLQGIQEVLEKLKTKAVNGRFDTRGETSPFKGELAGMVQGFNDVFDAVSNPLGVVAEHLARLAKGEIPEKIAEPYKGDFQGIRNDVNTLLETLSEATRFAEQMAVGKLTGTLKEHSSQDALSRTLNAMQGSIRKVLRETSSQIQAVQGGRLDLRGDADAFAGNWRDLVSGINSVVETFTSPLNVMTAYLDRLSQGDIPEKIGVEYKGDFNKIKNTLNALIDETYRVITIAQEITAGNLNINAEERSDRDKLRKALKEMVIAIQGAVGVPAKGAKDLDAMAVPGSDQDLVSHSLQQMMSSFQAMMGEMEKSVTEVQQQNWLRAGQTELSNILRGDQDVTTLAKDVIAFLVKYARAQVGTLYLTHTENEQVTLRLAGSYAYTRRKDNKTEFAPGEGLVGQAALEKETILFSEVPEDYMWVGSGLGKTPLRYLLVTPFMYAGELKGVIELGTAHEFSGLYLNFLDQVRESLAMTFHSVQTRAKMRVPLETIRQQTEELQQQREQLRVRYAELEAQTRTLRESEYELRQQQEQFQARRAELEAQARTLQEFEQKLRQQQEQLQANQEELVSRAWTLRESKQEFRQEQEQFRASREELAAQHRALQESERELQQQQEQFRANQEDSESRSRAFQESERTLQHQQPQLQARQAELETQARTLREFEQKLQQQREKLQQKDEELSRRARDLEKYREVMKGRVLALERAQRLVKEKIQDLNLSGKYKPEFLANMSYKLRTSLNRLLILSNLLLENKERNLTAKQVEFARTINASVTKLLALINEVLHLSKVELGTIELHVEDLSLKGLVSSIEQHFAPVAAEKGLYLVVNLADGLPATIRTDRQQVEQIVKQFLSNAFKFTEQGSVSVRITRPAPGVELSPKGLTLQNAIAIAVTDTGIGVPQDKQRVIFEAFQQANGTTSRKYGGTGLGLAIARGLAKLLGGEIQVHSEEGRGSTFTLYLPEKLPIAQAALLPDVLGETAMAFTAEEEVASVDPTSVSARPISHQEEQDAVRTIAEAMTTTVKNVLIVENDGLTLMSMVELLSGSGVEITTAETGQDAYRQLQTTRFDCMILDINLTDLSAFELLDMIEEDPLIAPLPIIVYTDRELTPEENRGLQQYTKGPLITDVNSPEQILDEMTGLLLQAGPGLPTEQQQQLRIFQGRDPVLDKKTILVVDDVPSTDSLTNVLQEKGLQVLLAENEAAALQQLNAHPEIDLVLMDLMQPEMNGYDVTRKIRKDTRFMKLPVIALTGKALDGDRQKCLEAGANDYLSKPVDTDELLSLLRVWLY